MKRKSTGRIPLGFKNRGPSEERSSARPLSNPVLLTRWVLVLTICYAVVTGTDASISGLRNLFIAALLGTNLFSIWVLRRADSTRMRWLVTSIDVAVVSISILLVGNATTDFFLVFFLVLLFAVQSLGAVEAGALSLGVSLLYGVLLHHELGRSIWFDGRYLTRLAFLFAMGFFFSAIADEAKRQQRRAKQLASRMQSVATHAKTLARDKYRLRALSEIGRLGLAGSGAAGRDVLYQISKRLQKGVGVDRCSLVIFGTDDDPKGYVAASSDDDSVEVRMLDVRQYPELQATLTSGEITEVHPSRPADLWNRIREFLPNVSRFNSFLVVPIKTDGKVLGAFYLRDHDPERRFNEEERDFCRASALMTASFIRGRDLVDQLRVQSREDGLTGLLNFQAFTEEIHRELNSPDVHERAPYTLVVVDMDNLKEINDLYGHMAGNRAIIELGARFRAVLPSAFAMCRYGGDEFVALVASAPEATIGALERMLQELSAMQWDAPFRVRASIGVAEFPVHGENAEALLEAADRAMYLAKGNGGHQVRAADLDADEDEIYDAVVAVQTRRIMPQVQDAFNAQLNELQRRAILGLKAPVVKQAITALMEAVESQDPLSEEHSVQVSELCRELATRLKLSEHSVMMIEIAGHLHDVGKIKLPPEILTKPGQLTPEERTIVQNAPAEGARILASLPGLRRVAKLVRTCHERWDGSGYPEGLRGDDIPLGAQVVGICDVYNALVSPRAQRPPLEEAVALRMIEQEIGKSWNPRIAREFLGMLAQRHPAADHSKHTAAGNPVLSRTAR